MKKKTIQRPWFTKRIWRIPTEIFWSALLLVGLGGLSWAVRSARADDVTQWLLR